MGKSLILFITFFTGGVPHQGRFGSKQYLLENAPQILFSNLTCTRGSIETWGSICTANFVHHRDAGRARAHTENNGTCTILAQSFRAIRVCMRALCLGGWFSIPAGPSLSHSPFLPSKSVFLLSSLRLESPI